MRVFLLSLMALCLVNCGQEKPSLQKYFVKSADKKEFITLDVSSSILNIDKSKLTTSEKQALASFDKVNILAYKKNEKSEVAYKKEIADVKEILKDTIYEPLIKLNGKNNNASIMLVGDDKAIDELVLFGNQNELGFTVIRVLGNNMKPEQALEFLSILQKSSIDTKQLQPIFNFVNKK
ncbi:DUF4252 domain-containing protein [Flavobacterium sp.]|jgi:hypothetical protein|uniref:DUF4252 domain-containing protein n=1 Tax=Flavobacterium sp. TaxID=239 RepID=UPI0037BE7B56